ncbi:MAG: hypothetical protein II749_05530 [Clostridia bacterium]|nr:hypothetical protein [Clostridia bacterium]
MKYAYSVMSIAFACFMLFYAAVLALTRNRRLIPREKASYMKDPERYCIMFAVIIAFIALPFLISGLIALLSLRWGLISLVILLIAAIYLSSLIYRRM